MASQANARVINALTNHDRPFSFGERMSGEFGFDNFIQVVGSGQQSFFNFQTGVVSYN